MRIWVKIFLFVFAITMTAIQVVLMIATAKLKDQVIDLNGEKLRAIAVSASSIVDPDTYALVDFTNFKDPENDEYFLTIRNLLRKTKNNLGLKEEIYTLNRVNKNAAVFGIMTNKISFVGDTLHLESKTARDAIDYVYTNKRAYYTNIYEDQYGVWLSGLAPMIDKSDKVVGIIQVDHESSHVYAEFEEIESYINYIRLGAIPLLLILSILVSKVISSPISNLTSIIDNIASGDYREPKKIKAASKEIKRLVKSTDIMRKTILEQQSNIFEKIDQLKDAYEKLEKAKAKVDASDKLKSDFLTIISHEIRTPLNVIMGNLDIIKHDYSSIEEDDLNEIFESIQTGSDRLLRTIELIVTLSELQSSTYEADIRELDLAELVSEIAEEYKKRCDFKEIEISFLNKTYNCILNADKNTIRHAVDNLVDNAVKFTHKGNVQISLYNDGENISLEVRDTGIGISKEFFPELFKPFKQEESGYTRKYDGNGLGLTLIKKSLELNGGCIKVESEKGRGSSFTITFPEANKKEDMDYSKKVCEDEFS